MNKTLEERLRDAKGVLNDVNTAIGRHPGTLPAEAEDLFRKVVDFRSDIDHWIGMLRTSAAALQLLNDLESKADENDCVPLGDMRIKFQLIRFIGVQAYITTIWALADSITSLAGRVLCTPESGFNEVNLAKLSPHFISQKRTKVTAAAAIYKSVSHAFGWPIGVFYAIRNHFVHECAQIWGSNFFEGPSAASAFRISVDGWRLIEDRATKVNGVDPSYLRPGVAWPTKPRDDLRIVLTVCQREMDAALGVLLGSACGSLRSHVGFMLDED